NGKGNGKTVGDERLRKFVADVVEFRHLRDRLAKRRVPVTWLEAFVHHRPLTRKRISREMLLAELARALGRPDVTFTARGETEEGITAVTEIDGHEPTLNLSLFESGEWAKLLEVYAQIEPFDRPPFTLVTPAGQEVPIGTKDALVEQVLNLGREGSSIQRYK